MRLKTITAAAAALTMTASPVMAATVNPATSLSVAKSVRASSPTTSNKNELAGAGIFGLVIAAGIAAILVVAIVNDGDNSDSN